MSECKNDLKFLDQFLILEIDCLGRVFISIDNGKEIEHINTFISCRSDFKLQKMERLSKIHWNMDSLFNTFFYRFRQDTVKLYMILKYVAMYEIFAGILDHTDSIDDRYTMKVNLRTLTANFSQEAIDTMEKNLYLYTNWNVKNFESMLSEYCSKTRNNLELLAM